MLALEDFLLLASGTESVENDTFKALSTLKTLELWKNKLRRVPRALPASLEVLKLNDNSIHVLHGSDFEGLEKLKILELKNNLISSVSPSTLLPCQSAKLDVRRQQHRECAGAAGASASETSEHGEQQGASHTSWLLHFPPGSAVSQFQ